MSANGSDNTVCYTLSTITIDPARIQEDYARLLDMEWINQDRYKAGMTNWKGVSLYSISGAYDDLRCADRGTMKKTPAGERCPYICDEVLPQFNAPLLRVALYRLTAGTKVGAHRDYGGSRLMGMVRIHMPVITNDGVIMYLDGQKYFFAVGEAWYFDATCVHAVENNGTEDRIHLIADFLPSPGINKHLKPVTLADRWRHVMDRGRHARKVVSTFTNYVRTPEGRARIKARLNVVMGRPG